MGAACSQSPKLSETTSPARFSIAAMSASGMSPCGEPITTSRVAPGASDPAHCVSSSTSMRSPSSARMPGSAPGKTRTGASWKLKKLLENRATSVSAKLLRATTAIECPAPVALVLVAPRAEAVGDLGRVEPAVEERRAAVLLGGDERVECAAVPEPEEHGHVPEAQVGRRAARGRHGGERARHRPSKLAQ